MLMVSRSTDSPLRVEVDPANPYLVLDPAHPKKRPVASTWVGIADDKPEQRHAADARRIAAAWNATRHLTVEDLETMAANQENQTR
jgi:hypothetical protein